LIAQVYDSFGAEVHVLGRNQWQLGLARQLGLTHTVNTLGDQWKKHILDSTSGVGPRIVVEATGDPEGLRMALEVVRSGGIVAMKSHYDRNIEIDSSSIVERQISLQGSTAGSYDTAIDMLAKGQIEVKRLVSKEFSLEKGIEAFEYADKSSVAKVVVRV
jgi:threonine dehydrogenase-like Zn-dependent dehydrogenase